MKKNKKNTRENIVLLSISSNHTEVAKEHFEVILRDKFISKIENIVTSNNYNRPDITIRKIRELFHNYHEGK